MLAWGSVWIGKTNLRNLPSHVQYSGCSSHQVRRGNMGTCFVDRRIHEFVEDVLNSNGRAVCLEKVQCWIKRAYVGIIYGHVGLFLFKISKMKGFPCALRV